MITILMGTRFTAGHAYINYAEVGALTTGRVVGGCYASMGGVTGFVGLLLVILSMGLLGIKLGWHVVHSMRSAFFVLVKPSCTYVI
jgi:hypothetical protein